MTTPDDDRERIEALLARAERVVHQEVPARTGPTRSTIALIGAGVVAVIIGISVAMSGTNGPSVVGQTTAVPLAATTIGSDITSPIVITLPPNPTTTSSTVAASTTTVQADSTADAVNGPQVRWISYRNGAVTLRGTVPDQATADAISRALSGAFGAANVLGDYTVNTGAPTPLGDPLYAHDAVQFAGVGAELDATAMHFLDLVIVLLTQNPAVTMDVNAYTDATALALADSMVSQARANVVFDYLVAGGVNPARLTHTGFGGTAPVASDATPAGQALNRRVEFVLHHLAG